MDRHQKVLDHILMRRGDNSVPFDALCRLLVHLGFRERIKGDHHIFTRTGVEEIINLQPLQNKAKAYQIKQVREIILRYNIRVEE